MRLQIHSRQKMTFFVTFFMTLFTQMATASLSVREAQTDIRLLIINDIPINGEAYYRNGRLIEYANLSRYSGVNQFCIFNSRGLTKGITVSMTSVRSEKIYTPIGSFEGLVFEFEGGAKMQVAGSFDSPISRVFESCLGPIGSFRTNSAAVQANPFQESESLADQLEAFRPRALHAAIESSCPARTGIAANWDPLFADLSTILRLAQRELGQNSTNPLVMEQQLRSGVQETSLSRPATRVRCYATHDRRVTCRDCLIQCSINLLSERSDYISFSFRKGETTINEAYAQTSLKGGMYPSYFNIMVNSKDYEAYLAESRAPHIFRNWAKSVRDGRSIDVFENSVSLNSRPSPICGDSAN